jgi:hypothetical protein
MEFCIETRYHQQESGIFRGDLFSIQAKLLKSITQPTGKIKQRIEIAQSAILKKLRFTLKHLNMEKVKNRGGSGLIFWAWVGIFWLEEYTIKSSLS